MSQDENSASPLLRGRGRLLVPIAAIAAIVIGLAATGVIDFSPSLTRPIPAAPILSTKVGEVRQIALADASQLILDTDARVITAFTQKQRWIEVQKGRVRVVVAKDKIRPFVVAIGRHDVITSGTMFDVSLKAGVITLNMLHGSAEIRGKDRSAINIGSGDKISIPIKGDAAPILSRAATTDGQWVDDIQGFRDVPVRDIIAIANEYGTNRIGVANPALADQKISGQINMRSQIAAAQAIAEQLGGKVDQSQAGQIIIDAPVARAIPD